MDVRIPLVPQVPLVIRLATSTSWQIGFSDKQTDTQNNYSKLLAHARQGLMTFATNEYYRLSSPQILM